VYPPVRTTVVFQHRCLIPPHHRRYFAADISAPGIAIAADISAPEGIAAVISAIAANISATEGIAADISALGVIAADISAPGIDIAVLCRWRLTGPTQGSRHHSVIAVNVDLVQGKSK
jgi:hypothetical protein